MGPGRRAGNVVPGHVPRATALQAEQKHPVYDRLRVIRCPSLVVSMGKDEETRHFAGLLGGQIRQTLLSHRYDEDVVREVKGSDVPLAMQNDIRAWLDEACRHMDTSPVEQTL